MNIRTIADANERPPDLFVTSAALDQGKRAPNLRAEALAFCELSTALAEDPRRALRHLLEIARHLCGAGSAGLSLLRHDQSDQITVRWEAISGALAEHEGTDLPLNCSPCGVCLDCGVTILISRPERILNYPRDARPSIAQQLIAPLYDNGKKPLGTLWIAHHDPAARFSADDARIAEQLAAQLVLTLRLMDDARDRQDALALLKSHQEAQQSLLAYDLYRVRSLHEQTESESRQALAFKDAMIHEVNHRAKNTLQLASSLLTLHAQAASSEVREALLASQARLQLLAKAHELLYLDPDNRQTCLMPRLLQALVDALRQSFASVAGHVRLDLTADPIALPVKQAIPIALLANEAVTNAYKHAFPNETRGRITAQLRCGPEGGLVLRIEDDGVGMHRSSGNGGMGLKLIQTFAAQLGGTLDVATQADGAGTAITVTLQLPPQEDVAEPLLEAGGHAAH